MTEQCRFEVEKKKRSLAKSSFKDKIRMYGENVKHLRLRTVKITYRFNWEVLCIVDF